MSTLRIIDAEQVATARWKNGGGTTRALLSLPSEDSWHLRITLADVEQDGPFSPYPGIQRWIAIVEGWGVRLEFDDRRQTLSPGDEPLAFDGGAPPHGHLVQGPTRDLNLMSRGGRAGMHRALPGTPWRARQRSCGLFALQSGTWSCADGRRVQLASHALLWFDDAPPQDMVFEQAGLWLEFSAPGHSDNGACSST